MARGLIPIVLFPIVLTRPVTLGRSGTTCRLL
jgi:hypothetical protein